MSELCKQVLSIHLVPNPGFLSRDTHGHQHDHVRFQRASFQVRQEYAIHHASNQPLLSAAGAVGAASGASKPPPPKSAPPEASPPPKPPLPTSSPPPKSPKEPNSPVDSGSTFSFVQLRAKWPTKCVQWSVRDGKLPSGKELTSLAVVADHCSRITGLARHRALLRHVSLCMSVSERAQPGV